MTLDAAHLLTDRRRPGRPQEVSPALLPLIREDMLPSEPQPQRPMEWPEEDLEHDELSTIRGIMYGVAIALPIWAVLGLGIDYLVD